MNSKTLLIFTRTPLHVGAGSSVSAVDQPIIRERATGHPVIPGSSVKGVLRAHFSITAKDCVKELFGPEPGNFSDDEAAAGALSFSEARPVLFPVRSARGAYALVTCPLALSRYDRDACLKLAVPAEPADNQCLSGETVNNNGKVVLEEYCFERTGEFPSEWSSHLSNVLDDAVLKAAENRFVLLSDGDFAHFVRNACEVRQHVGINPETGTARKGVLFNEECVPSETLFHTSLSILRNAPEDNPVFSTLAQEQLLQFGGDATTGLGFCTVKLN
jgi:CRISPR-associated protein Cmr4